MKANAYQIGKSAGQCVLKAHDVRHGVFRRPLPDRLDYARENTMNGLPSAPQDVSHGPLLDLLLGEVLPRLARPLPREAEVTPRAPTRPKSAPTDTQAARTALVRVASTPPHPRFTADEAVLRDLMRLSLRDDRRSVEALLAQQLQRGQSLEFLLLGLIQPVARRLGQAWSDDELSFADVTVGVGLLQSLMNRIVGAASTAAAQTQPQEDRPRALFATLPGCQHRLGVQMLSALFGLTGWRSAVSDDLSEEALLSSLREQQPVLFGLSLGSDFELDRGRAFILRVRHVIDPHHTAIMIGGPAIIHYPDRARELGADLVCGDADDALSRAACHLEERGLVSV